ncbi:MAG: winged helix-turn-helix domain-containing protein [Deltaproteobacteria bacterium]|nr:winged helix-turn-helix domain-containing protein [Deltaproteobacteria bacterium]
MRNNTIAKVNIPVIGKVLNRKRLFHTLDQIGKKKVIWVKGLPGSGKTTLVASYLAAKKIIPAWYTMDSSDGDLATFFYYLRYVVRGLTPSQRVRLPLLTPEYLANITVYARRYFENLYSMLPPRFVLVFDNYHEVKGNPLFAAILTEVLTIVPEHSSVVVISRASPPESLIRLRANSEMEIIDDEALKFNLEETKELVRLYPAKSSGKGMLQEMYDASKGWAAGIILLLGQHTRPEVASYDAGQNNQQEIFNYFSLEIFNRLDPATRDFLLQTSFFPFMTVEMAVRLTENNLSGKVLDSLVGSSYFTVRDQNNTYRYHDLFRAFLMSRANTIWPREQLNQVRQHAARILEDARHIEDATALFLESEDWTDAVRVILQHAEALVSQGRNQSLEAWLRRLPQSLRDRNPWLSYWLGACRLPFNPGEGYALFRKAFNLFTVNKDRNGIFMAWTGVSDAISYGFGKLRLHDTWIKRMEELVKTWKGFPATKAEEIAVIKMLYAMNFRQHFNPAIKKWVQRTEILLDKSDSLDMKVQVSTILSLYFSTIGEIRSEEPFLLPIKNLKYSHRISPTSFLALKIIEVLYNYYTVDDDPGFGALNDGIHLAETTGIHIMDNLLISFGAAWVVHTGNVRLAEEYLQKISGTIEQTGVYDRAIYYIIRTSVAMIKKDFVAAYNFQKTGLQPAVDSGDINLMVMSSVQMAQIYHERSDDIMALQYLNKASRVVQQQRHFRFMYLIVKALFAFDRHNERSGLTLLRRAMQLGQDIGCVNFPGWRPSVMARLCVKALEHGINREYVKSLIKKRNLVPDTPPLACGDWPWALRIYTLGRFRILRDDVPVTLSKKTQAKPMELLYFLIAHDDKPVEVDSISSALWPDAPGDDAHRSLDTTLHRLRKILGLHDAIVALEGTIALNNRLCWTDVAAFNHGIAVMNGLLDTAGHTANQKDIREKADAVIHLYRGPFLVHEDAPLWSMNLKEKLHNKFIRFLGQLGAYYRKTGNVNEARSVYQTGLESDAGVELFYQQLMEIYRSLGRNAEAASVYKRCEAVLSGTLGIELSEKTRALYRSVIQDKQ